MLRKRWFILLRCLSANYRRLCVAKVWNTQSIPALLRLDPTKICSTFALAGLNQRFLNRLVILGEEVTKDIQNMAFANLIREILRITQNNTELWDSPGGTEKDLPSEPVAKTKRLLEQNVAYLMVNVRWRLYWEAKSLHKKIAGIMARGLEKRDRKEYYFWEKKERFSPSFWKA